MAARSSLGWVRWVRWVTFSPPLQTVTLLIRIRNDSFHVGDIDNPPNPPKPLPDESTPSIDIIYIA